MLKADTGSNRTQADYVKNTAPGHDNDLLVYLARGLHCRIVHRVKIVSRRVTGGKKPLLRFGGMRGEHGGS